MGWNMEARATSVSDVMLIWHNRWKHFSLSHFRIRFDLDLALLVNTCKLKSLQIWCWSGIIGENILAEPLQAQIWFRSGIMGWNMEARATSVSDVMLIWHYRWKHFSLSHFCIRSDLDGALLVNTCKLKPLQYQIWCWSGIIGENILT